MPLAGRPDSRKRVMMLSRWQWLLRQLGRRLWVRVSLFSLGAVVTALLGTVLEGLIPNWVPAEIGVDALDNILGILASSMLAVTTFSLTTMVTAYTATTSNATPRSSQLLMDDPTTQNALGTFIGSFVFSLVGIILLTTGAYGENGRLVLFIVTIAVVILIVVTMLRWIDYLSTVGRTGEITDKVEAAAAQALRQRMEQPYLGGRPLRDGRAEVPPGAVPVHGEQIGYVQHIDIEALDEAAAAADGEVFVLVLPGSFVDPSKPLAMASGVDDEQSQKIAESFTIGHERSFDQDPRFGICVLAEIASRALSSGVNDPGTAIDVIGSGVRVLAAWRPPDDADAAADADAACRRVRVPPLDTAGLFDDFFGPIARDGAAIVEVQIRLQKGLATLAALGSPAIGENARRHAARALARAEQALALEADKATLRDLESRLSTPG